MDAWFQRLSCKVVGPEHVPRGNHLHSQRTDHGFTLHVRGRLPAWIPSSGYREVKEEKEKEDVILEALLSLGLGCFIAFLLAKPLNMFLDWKVGPMDDASVKDEDEW